MNKFIKMTAALLAIAFLTSCASNPAARFTTALKHVQGDGELNPHSKIGEGVYVVTLTNHGSRNSKVLVNRLIISAGELTLKKGYNRLVFFRDSRNDHELKSAIANKTVRRLFLKRIRNKAEGLNRLAVGRNLYMNRYTREVTRVGRADAYAIVIMFKDGKTGGDVHTAIRKAKKRLAQL